MFKNIILTFSKIMCCGALITSVISNNINAAELNQFNADPVSCQQTHQTLSSIGANLDVTELAAVEALERAPGSNRLEHTRVLGCQVCGCYFTALTRLQVNTTEGELLLLRAIQTYTQRNPQVSLNGLTWGEIRR